MARLTDAQLVILSTASRRDDRGVDLPTNVTGEALRKAVDKLIRTELLEEVRAHGSLMAWRRDAEAGPMALRGAACTRSWSPTEAPPLVTSRSASVALSIAAAMASIRSGAMPRSMPSPPQHAIAAVS